jgi:hypothetical protein
MSRQEIDNLSVADKLQLLDFILDNSLEALYYGMEYCEDYIRQHDAIPNITFSPPNPNKCEGYWTKTKDNKYLPIISDNPWIDKSEWLQKAYIVNSNTPMVAYRGLSFSRLDGSVVGNEEYQDTTNNICWPQGYIEHYIRDHNVMPTEKFYNYINTRYEQLTS